MTPNRRDFLQWGLNVTAAASLASCSLCHGASTEPSSPEPRTFKPGKAKSVIQIWLAGGPPHTDMFDPKPETGKDYCGTLDKPIDTVVPNMQIGQLFPKLATQADKFSIIRSMTHGNNNHEQAAYIMQTGREPGAGISYPNIGAIVSLFKGVDAGYDSPIPPYIVLTSGQGRFSEAGFLGPKYKPFITGGDPVMNPFLVSGFVTRGMTPERQRERRDMLAALDTLGRADTVNPLYEQIDTAIDDAYNVIQGDAVKTFDLQTEDAAVRDKYGRHRFGQSCLVARRLVEQGVPYITINSGGWDTHKRHFEAMNRLLPEVDSGLASLIEELATRNLLETTVIWVCGEFGRTPKVDSAPPWFNGRHHFGSVFSVLVAGGGFQGGKVVGASNETGENVASRPVKPQDLLGSILELLAINPDDPMPNTRGYAVPVMLEASESGRLHEIIS